MDLIYDKVAMQEYMDDIGGVGESLRRIKDESFSAYNSCEQHYSRLHTELEEANRKAYNMIESAESLQRSAETQTEFAIRMLNNAQEDSEIRAAQEQLRQAQAMQAQAAQEMAVASAAYEKAQANMKKLTSVWEQYQPSANTARSHAEDSFSSFNIWVSDGSRDLKEYMGVLDKAQALYNESIGADSAQTSATPSSSSVSSFQSSSAVTSSEGISTVQSSASSSSPSSPSSNSSVSSDGFSVVSSNGATHSLSPADGNKIGSVSYAFESAAGNMLSVSSTDGSASITMTLADKNYTFPGTKSGAAKAYREALKSGDGEMIAQTEAMFKAAAPTAYNDIFTSQHTKYITVPYQVTSENNETKDYTYDLPIVCNCSFSDLPQHAKGFNAGSEAASKWAHENYEQWRSELSKKTESAFITYTSSDDYIEINDANRGNIPMEGRIKDVSDSLDEGLNAASLPEEITVYRGVSEHAIVDMALKAGGKLESGIILEDQGYLSTSLVSNTDFTRDSKYIMRLTAVPGLHGAPLEYGDLSLIPAESEMLFGRNHNIYVRNVTETKRSDLIPGSKDDSVIIIDGILTI